MTCQIPEDQLIRVAEYVAQTLGLHFPAERRRDLERGIMAAASELEFADTPAFLNCLLFKNPTKEQLEVLASHLTVGETYFFRETGHFDFLAKHILPALISERQNTTRHLRIWSAACCSGEEPYSIAILLRRMIPAHKDWNLSLLATDINPRFLEKAEAGIYGEWSFRNSPAWLKGQYFRERGNGRFEVLPEIKRMVRFTQLNLAEDVYPSLSNDTNAMDIILCRNVLMYFTADQAHNVIRKLHRAQVEGGWLFVGPSELLHVSPSPYLMVKTEETILYQKNSCRIKIPALPSRKPDEVFHPSLLSVQPVHQVQAVEAPPPRPVDGVKEALIGSEISDELYATAVALYEQGRYVEAVEKLRAMPSARPHGPVLRLLARCYANQGLLAEALACCDEWIASDKLNASCHYVRATILQEQNMMEEAVRSLRRTVYLDNGFVLAHFTLGNIARRRGRGAEAKRHFENARLLLCARRNDEILTESEGMTAGRLLEVLSSFSGAARAL